MHAIVMPPCMALRGRRCAVQEDADAVLGLAREIDDMYALLADVGQRIPTADQVRASSLQIFATFNPIQLTKATFCH